jgi:outer membrane protein
MRRTTCATFMLVWMLWAGAVLAQDRLGSQAAVVPAVPQNTVKQLPPLEAYEDHVQDGRLVLSLDDTIRLALANNTDVSIERATVSLAQNDIGRQHQHFDPTFTASFDNQRATSPAFQELAGASILKSLSQTVDLNYAQTFQTGTTFQTDFQVNRYSTNSSFYFFSPYLFSNWTFQLAQPLLRNFGLFPNRAPILIAQRGFKQARSTFEAQVNDIIQQAVVSYWSVILQRESFAVQKKSLDEAQQSYDRDKKALGLGALPPLDIYRSESQVAARRVSVIQAEYALIQAVDTLRRFIGADRDPSIRVLDLDLTDDPTPAGELVNMDIETALDRALSTRPEFEVSRQALTVDEMKIRLARNQLRPDLQLTGLYSSTGLSGDEFSFDNPPQLISRGGLGDSLSQAFHFNNPTYEFKLKLTLPIKNHSARADLADARISQTRDRYQQAKTTEGIVFEVTDAVHKLEEAKLTLAAARVSVDLAEKNLRAEERKHELGSETAFFVLDAQTQLAQAEFARAQAAIGYQLALAALDHATGELLPHHGVNIQEPRPRGPGPSVPD